MEPADIRETLAGSELFMALETGDIEAVAGICEVRTYHIGERIYQQGGIGEHLYIIAEGQVILERSLSIGKREGRVILATLGKGRVFGCWSTLLNEPHIMMLRTYCQTPATILTLKGSELRALMMRNSDFGFKVMERLCLLLRERIQSAYGALEKI